MMRHLKPLKMTGQSLDKESMKLLEERFFYLNSKIFFLEELRGLFSLSRLFAKINTNYMNNIGGKVT